MQQRLKDDCAICCVAMATGKSYEYVMSKALKYNCRSEHWTGTIDIPMLLIAIGVKNFKEVERITEGKKALLFFVNKYRKFIHCHMMYYDGEELNDPAVDPIMWDHFVKVIEIYE
jgi:hypothetical protein